MRELWQGTILWAQREPLTRENQAPVEAEYPEGHCTKRRNAKADEALHALHPDYAQDALATAD
jgi:hypothetical protein